VGFLYSSDYCLLIQNNPSLPEKYSMNIKVKVFAPGFIDHGAIDSSGFFELHEGDTVNQLLRKLRVPLYLRPFLICSINCEQLQKETVLKDGDVVSFVMPVSGG
jgi:molybdopterin converting factor small subunit